MSVVALVAYLAFLLVTLGWRSWRQYRRTGDWGFRGVSGHSGSALVGGGLLVAGGITSLLAPVFDLLELAEPARFLARPAAYLAGGLLMGAGLVVTLVAQLHMGDSWRVGVAPAERTTLVTHGIFRRVRNPIFTGMLVALLGFLLWVPNLLALAGLALVGTGLELQVRRVEEPYLLRTHGEPYRRYARAVGRFLPGIGRLR